MTLTYIRPHDLGRTLRALRDSRSSWRGGAETGPEGDHPDPTREHEMLVHEQKNLVRDPAEAIPANPKLPELSHSVAQEDEDNRTTAAKERNCAVDFHSRTITPGCDNRREREPHRTAPMPRGAIDPAASAMLTGRHISRFPLGDGTRLGNNVIYLAGKASHTTSHHHHPSSPNPE